MHCTCKIYGCNYRLIRLFPITFEAIKCKYLALMLTLTTISPVPSQLWKNEDFDSDWFSPCS